MPKLVAAIAFLAVTVLPATALARPHWYRGEDTQVIVYMERTRVAATNWSYVKRAGAQWARSSRIQVEFVKRCQLLLREGLPGPLDPPAGRP